MDDNHLILEGRLGDRDVLFELADGEHLLGRAEDCDVVLAEPSISRHHARIERRGGRARIRDLGSHNGTQVDGATVGSEWLELAPGARLVMGRAQLTVGGAAANQAQLTVIGGRTDTGLALSWREAVGREPGERPSGRGRRKRAALFSVLAEAGSLLISPGKPEDLYEPILDLVDLAVSPERALVVLLDEKGDPRVRASRVEGGEAADVVMSRTMVDRVINERSSFLIEDAQQDAALQAHMSIVSRGMRGAMAAPLFDNERVIGLLYADSTDPSVRYTADELKAFSLLANCVAVALTHARYHAVEAEKRRLETELDAARRIMTVLLPTELPEVPGWELLAHLDPCYEVAGDLYDSYPLPDGRVAIVIGDVSGKGLGAALLVSSLLPLLRGLTGACQDLAALVARLNEVLFVTTDPIRYATLFVGLLDPASGELAYVNAGHNPPYVVDADGAVTPLASTGLPVALVDEGAWKTATTTVEPGGMLALYTDGIPEAWNADDQDYGDERLRERLAGLGGRASAEVRDALLADLEAWVGDAPTSDDVTLVLLRRLP